MAKTGFIYSTVDGHTLDICRRLAEIVEAAGDEAVLIELTPEADVDLASLDQIVIGASIRYGKHKPEVSEFIEKNVDLLRTKPSAF